MRFSQKPKVTIRIGYQDKYLLSGEKMDSQNMQSQKDLIVTGFTYKLNVTDLREYEQKNKL